MDAEGWNRLSAWHNTWLEAGPVDRQRLRDRLAIEQPELVAEFDAILADSTSLEGFLEVPAFVEAAQELAEEAPALAPGTAVGPYRIVELVAHGGMGDVYRATDVRLNRDVALKVLTHAAHCDPRSIARFEQEARMTAALDHPNIVKIYDVGAFAGRPYLVAEMLTGETLRSRLTRQPIHPAEACRIAVGVSHGLVAAHAAGLVHRDLKPENIFLTQAGVTKLLDFGIAKLVDQDQPPSDGSVTFTGALLGTAGYLAPEQIERRSVDGRADLFSLGSILFEMVTGQRAFARDTTIDTLYAIVHDAPPDVLAERSDLPAGLHLVVTRLLEKAPEARFQSAADLAWTLGRLDAVPIKPALASGSQAPPMASMLGVRLLLWMATGLAAAALAGWAIWPRAAAPAARGSAAQFTWTLPAGLTLESEPAVSPDGRRIAFVGASDAGRRLYVRELASLEATPINDTEGAKQPFWSPDGDALGFFANGRLKRVNLNGGAPVDLASAPDARGGTWSRSGVIVLQSFFRDRGLSRVSVNGGEVQPATLLDVSSSDTTHKWPVFLPDGDHFLYLLLSVDENRRGIYAGRLSGPPAHPTAPLLQTNAGALYVLPQGRDESLLMLVSGGSIQLWPFDAQRLTITGDPQTIGLAAADASLHFAAMLGVSPGVLAFARTQVPTGFHFASVDVDGTNLSIRSDREIVGQTRLSPSGTHIARTMADRLTGDSDVWVEGLTQQTRVRITTSRDLDLSPVWSPDGRHLAYRSGPFGASNLSIASADGTGVVKVLRCPGEPCHPTDWSPDGQWLVLNATSDVWKVEVERGSASPLLNGRFMEHDARISPDGRWIAYVSNESGRPEVYVRTLSPPLRRVVASTGGNQPVWRRNGRGLFYVTLDNELHVVPIQRDEDGTPVVGARVKLPIGRFGPSHVGTTYDVSPDARRVYFAHAGDPARPREIGFVLNWSALVR